MTFEPLLPWAILAVVAGALAVARVVSLRQALWTRRRGRAVLRWAVVTAAVLLLIAAATRPILVSENRSDTPTAAGEDLNVFLVADRTATQARDDIPAVLDQYPAARYALITFSSRASLVWPLSDDVWSLRPTVAALTPIQDDADPSLAGNTLQNQLVQATQQYPGAHNVVLYYGSGADDVELRDVARQFDVPYVAPESGQPVRLDQPAMPEIERIELYWLLAMLAAVLLLGEIYLTVRDFRRGRIARRDVT